MTPINLYSDTQTCPTQAMRAAIAAAEVGDEGRAEIDAALAVFAEALGRASAA